LYKLGFKAGVEVSASRGWLVPAQAARQSRRIDIRRRLVIKAKRQKQKGRAR
jgi:hypothetical protein